MSKRKRDDVGDPPGIPAPPTRGGHHRNMSKIHGDRVYWLNPGSINLLVVCDGPMLGKRHDVSIYMHSVQGDTKENVAASLRALADRIMGSKPW